MYISNKDIIVLDKGGFSHKEERKHPMEFFEINFDESFVGRVVARSRFEGNDTTSVPKPPVPPTTGGPGAYQPLSSCFKQC